MAATSQIKEKFEDYEGFVAKFKPKRTTDDCYTPQIIYDEIAKWVDEKICRLDDYEIIRPFYPGGDYENEVYPDNALVLDNPPFSIVSRICRFYNERGIKYFLFCPALTMFTSNTDADTYIVSHCEITYENGAVVRTGFRTNILNGDPKIIVAGDLFERVKNVQKKRPPTRRKIKTPWEVVSSALLGRIVIRGVTFSIPKAECYFTRKLDNLKGKIYGAGFLISERAAAERAAAERADVEERVELSPREREIIKSLNPPGWHK